MSYKTVCLTMMVTIGGEHDPTARERLRICGTLFRCLCTRPGSGLLELLEDHRVSSGGQRQNGEGCYLK